MGFRSLLKAVVEEGHTLSRKEACSVLERMLAPDEQAGIAPLTDAEIAALLTAIAMRGETVDELTGFVESMRALAVPLPLSSSERARLVDTCGTGGDGSNTFNISSGAALVTAAAGALVAKHGNRAVTSRCGSADVLEALGVPIDLEPEEAVACLRATGFMFLMAPRMHPALRRVAPVRRMLGFRTIFNLAGPLTNPAGAEAHVMGVFARSKVELVGQVLAKLRVRHAFVVHGSVGASKETYGESTGGDAGLDELTLTGESYVAEVKAVVQPIGPPPANRAPEPDNSRAVRLFTTTPEQAGLMRAPITALAGGDTVEENAAILMQILSGSKTGFARRDPRREIVLFNAAAALIAAGVARDFRDGVARGAEAIDSGAVLHLIEGLQQFGRERS